MEIITGLLFIITMKQNQLLACLHAQPNVIIRRSNNREYRLGFLYIRQYAARPWPNPVYREFLSSSLFFYGRNIKHCKSRGKSLDHSANEVLQCYNIGFLCRS